MIEFAVSPPKLKADAETMKKYEFALMRELFRLKPILVKVKGFKYDNLDRALLKIIHNISEEKEGLTSMRTNLIEAADFYIQTEAALMNSEGVNSSDTEKYNPAFDAQGSYGGNQSDPVNFSDNKELIDIVRKYYPDMSTQEVKEFLKKLKSEGCGYVALTNTIFAQYTGKEDEFKRIFGFSMYKDDGELNYEALVTDFYSATDDRVEKSIFEWDGIQVSSGTNMDTRKYRFELYMSDHGIHVEVKNDIKVTAQNYNEIAGSGEIVVGVHPCILYDKNGDVAFHINDGHAMTVTGVTDDGMLIVSSWGEKYYIKPEDESYDRMQFQQIIY